MDRRDFIKVSGVAAAAAALPSGSWANLSGMSNEAIEDKIKDLLGKLTQDEKLSMMGGSLANTVSAAFAGIFKPGQGHGYTGFSKAVDRLNIPSIKMLDGPRGVGFMYKTTCFPVGMARGATFDPELEAKVGEAMGYETRALGAHMLLAPCINVVWHPRWGRSQETYGEDPGHLGEMGAAFTRGLQKHVMACVKHYAVNNVEDTRMDVDAIVDERVLRETFIPHFKKCCDAGAASIMSAYNLVNGTKAGQNKRMTREILKEEWKWDGLVVSDWVTAMDDAAKAANGGLDLEMPQASVYAVNKLKAAVQSGQIKPEYIDDAVARILRATFRYVLPDFTQGYSQKEIAGAKHTGLAREVAEKGAVLLKNEGVLPLAGVKSIAVLGMLATKPNIGDVGSSRVTPPYTTSILKGLRKTADGIKISFCGGIPSRSKMLAKNSDAVIVVAGLGSRDENEGNDRDNLTLHPNEIELIKLAAANNKKTIVVLIGGSAITMEGWLDQVPAVLLAWYPGMEGGNAIARVLLGEVNPSGRLPLVFPKSEDQLYKFENKSLKVKYDHHHGYRWFDDKGLEPLFHFGHGLSYTSFDYSAPRLAAAEIGAGGKLAAEVEVKNTGSVAGETVVFLFVGAKNPPVARPKKDLRAFARVALAPGESKTVKLEVAADELARFDLEKLQWVLDAGDYEALTGPSADPKSLKATGFGVK